MVDDRRGSDQRILDQVITAPVEELCPRPKDAGINGKNVPSLSDKIDPCLDLGGLARVLFTRDLHACLQLAKSDGREMQIFVRRSIYPSHDRPVRSRFAQFGNDIRVEKVHGAQSNAGGSRRRRARRAGTGMSARGNSASSKSFRRGRVASSKLRHWSTRTSTAICTPRRVTICGPLVRLASSNSLKRALASCTGHILGSFFLATFRRPSSASHLTSQVHGSTRKTSAQKRCVDSTAPKSSQVRSTNVCVRVCADRDGELNNASDKTEDSSPLLENCLPRSRLVRARAKTHELDARSMRAIVKDSPLLS